jgi:hypothetical protein
MIYVYRAEGAAHRDVVVSPIYDPPDVPFGSLLGPSGQTKAGDKQQAHHYTAAIPFHLFPRDRVLGDSLPLKD